MIKDLQAKQGKVSLTATVVSIEEPREFQKFGNTGRVATAMIKDDSGEIKLTLWNDQIDQIKTGDKVTIENGYVNEWQGEMQLTTGRFGTLEVGEGSSEKSEDTASEEPGPDESITEDEATEEEDKDELKSDEGEQVMTEDEKVEEEVLDEDTDDKGEHVLTEDEKTGEDDPEKPEESEEDKTL